MTFGRYNVLFAASLVAAAITGRTCFGVLLAYDGFDYAVGSNIVGENGGSGWSNAWSGSTPSTGVGDRDVRSPGATYPLLETVGNKAFIAATNQTQRTLLAGVQGTGAETVWLSFIGQRVGPNNIRFFSVSFYEGTTDSGNERFSIGENSNNAGDVWGAHFTSTAQGRIEAAGASINTESFLLARVDYQAGANDNLYLWVNPNLSLEEPSTGTASASSIGAFNLAFDIVSIRAGTTSSGNHGEAYFDEVRIGTSFADVAPGAMACALGDVNCDETIDLENDFEAIRLHFRDSVASRSDGDLTGDGLVNFADFREWKAAFLSGGGSLEGVNLNFLTVPEPSTLSLLLLVALTGLCGARCRDAS